MAMFQSPALTRPPFTPLYNILNTYECLYAHHSRNNNVPTGQDYLLKCVSQFFF